MIFEEMDLFGFIFALIEEMLNSFLASIPFGSIFTIIGIILLVIAGMLFVNAFFLWFALRIMKLPQKYGQCVITQLYMTLSTLGFSLLPIVGSIFAVFFNFHLISTRHEVDYWNGALVWLLSTLIPQIVVLIIVFASLGLIVL